MNPQALAVLYALGSVYLLWVLFLGVMNLARVNAAGQLGPVAYVLAWPLLAVAVTLDILVNVVIGTLIWLEWPHYSRLTLSARLDNLIKHGTGWRQRMAWWTVKTLLEPFDTTGGHSAG